MKNTFHPVDKLGSSRKLDSLLVAAAIGATFGLVIPAARATPLGVSTDPMGAAWQRNEANTAFATWDSFVSTSFSNEAPDTSFGLSTAGLTQSSAFTNFAQGAGLYNVATSSSAEPNGDVLFPGGNSVNFTINGAVVFTINGLTLQIKRPSSTGTLADANGFSPLLSIDGGTPLAADGFSTTSGTGDTNSGNGQYSVTTWYWGASLLGDANNGGDTFALTFAKAGSQRLIDDIVVDAGSKEVVPEPSSAGLSIVALAALAAGYRRRLITRSGSSFAAHSA